jgi:16S rRNA U1498 N3-methylase RsmE
MPPARSPRFVITSPIDASGLAEVSGAELHHMRDVLRLPPGSKVSILDSDGVEHAGILMRYDRDRAI